MQNNGLYAFRQRLELSTLFPEIANTQSGVSIISVIFNTH